MLQYDKFLIGIFIIVIGIGFYIIYSVTYATLIFPKEVDPKDITVEQEKIQIERYNKTASQLEKKNQINDQIEAPNVEK